MKHLIHTMLLAAGLAAVASEAVAPDVMIRKASEDVVGAVDHDHLSANDQRFKDMLKAEVLPNFDFNRITALAVGHHWREASPQQQSTMTHEFETLLVRAYSSALTANKVKTIDVAPLHAGEGDKEVSVKSTVTPENGRAVAIDYHLERMPSGWKIYDVAVDGVSLVTNYRTQFDARIKQGGIDGLIKDLEARNAQQSK